MNTKCDNAVIPEEKSGVERERVIRANSTYCKACEENGIQVCSWEESPAWKDFVEGKINEAELTERARQELERPGQNFEAYGITPPGTQAGPDEYRDRAKQAGRIYRQVCVESGISRCFFQNFSTWSEYVHGRIGEAEFTDQAREQIAGMLENTSG